MRVKSVIKFTFKVPKIKINIIYKNRRHRYHILSHVWFSVLKYITMRSNRYRSFKSTLQYAWVSGKVAKHWSPRNFRSDFWLSTAFSKPEAPDRVEDWDVGSQTARFSRSIVKTKMHYCIDLDSSGNQRAPF